MQTQKKNLLKQFERQSYENLTQDLKKIQNLKQGRSSIQSAAMSSHGHMPTQAILNGFLDRQVGEAMAGS